MSVGVMREPAGGSAGTVSGFSGESWMAVRSRIRRLNAGEVAA